MTDYQTLVDSVRAGVEVVLIDTNQNGLAQMAQWAETHSGYDSIQIFSHGHEGMVLLGSSVLSATTIGQSDIQAQLGKIGQALNADGDIHLYGCNIGLDTVGSDLIQAVAVATGADVAASTNTTGPTRLGGDWTLEVSTGSIETGIVLDTASAENLNQLLPSIGSNLTDFWARPGEIGTTWVETTDELFYITAVTYAPGGLRGYFEWNNGSGWNLLLIYFQNNATNGGTAAPTGATIRYVDTSANDTTTVDQVSSVASHTNYTSSSPGSLHPDTPPTDITAASDRIAIGTPSGTFITTASPTDEGLAGKWVLEDQSVTDLFSVVQEEGASNLKIYLSTGTLPPVGQTATITLRYYDPFQLDSSDTPIPGEGISRTLSFTVIGPSRDLNFTDEAVVNTTTAGHQRTPSVTHLTNDNFVVVWTSMTQDAGGSSGIYGRLYNKDGVALDTEFAIASTVAAESKPSVTALSGDRFLVTYVDQDTNTIMYRLVAANGDVGDAVAVSAAGDWDEDSTPSVTTLSNGNFAIAWHSSADSNVKIATFDGSTGVQIGGLDTTPSNLTYPVIAALSNGEYVVSGTGPTGIQVWGNGGINVSIGDGDVTSSVVGLSGGGFVVVWTTTDWQHLSAQIYDNGGIAQGGTISVDTISGFAGTPTVAALTDGGFVVAWNSEAGDGSGTAIKGRRFDATGSAVDATEFQINQNPLGSQMIPSIAELPSGSFVTVWEDYASSKSTGRDVELRVLLVDNHAPVLSDTVLALTPVAVDAGAPSGAVGDRGFRRFGIPQRQRRGLGFRRAYRCRPDGDGHHPRQLVLFHG